MASKIVFDLLGLLTDEERAILRALSGARRTASEPGADAALILPHGADELCRKLNNVLSVDRSSGKPGFASAQIAELFTAALEDESSRSAGLSVARGRDLVKEILRAQSKGDYERAVELFRAAGGIYFIHYEGLDAALDVLNRFPQGIYEEHEMLTLALTMHALKAGNVKRALFLMTERFGDDMLSLEKVISETRKYSIEVRAFRFVMAIYEDVAISNELRGRLFDLLAEFPIDDHLHRGGFYNAMLAICIQRQELEVAEDIANRAHHHYRAANAHLLVFYIELHRVVFSLRKGLLAEAEISLAGARHSLSQVAFDTPTDWRLFGLLEAVVAYERGEPEALVRFVAEEFDKFAYGEIWPTVVELALVYCSQVLNSQIGLGAALTFLGKWRVQEWRSRRFNLAITMQEVETLQTANRWQAAMDRLMAVQSRINLTWVESAEEALTRLVDPTEIDLAMAWLRHLIQHVPRRPLLRRQIAALLRNDNLGRRERGRLQLWAAYLARAHRDITQARLLFSNVLEDIARTGIATHVLGDAAMIETLFDDKRIVDYAFSSAEQRNVIRRLQGFMRKRETATSLLSRQEFRVLRLVAEGGTNKFVARQMRLSEVTVKFHLSNIYRKMGCRRRSEAVAAARALGWVS